MSAETCLSVIERLRGDAKLKILGADMGDAGRRIRLAILKPIHPEDEIDDLDNWREESRLALRLNELDDLLAKLTKARQWLVE